MQQIIILCPFYNDEACFNLFAVQLEKEIQQLSGYQFSLLIVNDGSINKPSLTSAVPFTVLHLYRNLGHQKAIAIGLSYAVQNLKFHKIVVMDADGEDKPQDINFLLSVSEQTDRTVVAHRASRQNENGFKVFYFVYKLLFRILTGCKISFGNFMVLKKEDVIRLVYSNEIWNHLAGAIVKTNMCYSTVPLHRGRRHVGESRMNFALLLLHGLAAIGVFIEIIAVRLLIFSVAMIGFSVLAILIIVLIRFFTNAAIPGWATTAFSSMLIVLLQSCLLSLFTIFLYLSSQAQRQFIPANHYTDYLKTIETSQIQVP